MESFDFLNKADNSTSCLIQGGIGETLEEKYSCVNLIDGEILRIKHVKKIAKDKTGRYLYTARLESTSNKHDVESVDLEEGIPVIFSLPFRLNDIVNSDYDENYKAQLERGILKMLSLGYQRNLTPDGAWDTSSLHDIGGIKKFGSVIPNDRAHVTDAVISKIAELQVQYARAKKANRKEKQEREDR